MLRFLTAGESHGKGLVVILEGVPTGLAITKEYIDRDLKRRQTGYGRGGRMEIEEDQVEIISGIRKGLTMGGPIALLIENKDWENWRPIMDPDATEVQIGQHEEDSKKGGFEVPRPGHADLAGALKYTTHELRDILERASARETVARVAAGAVARCLLGAFGVMITSHVLEIGGIKALAEDFPFEEIRSRAEKSELRCVDPEAESKMKSAIDKAKKAGDSLGGIFEVLVVGLPPGLGSYVHWDRRLDGALARAVMSIPAIKGVEIGPGFSLAAMPGSAVQDEILYDKVKTRWGFYHRSNNAGGLEGGVTNGEPLILRAAMKPIPTLMTPLASVNIRTKKPEKAWKERSDVCAVPAAGVVAEGMAALTLACAFLEKFGCDSMAEMVRNFAAYLKCLGRV